MSRTRFETNTLNVRQGRYLFKLHASSEGRKVDKNGGNVRICKGAVLGILKESADESLLDA
jgi:hypothetical protein